MRTSAVVDPPPKASAGLIPSDEDQFTAESARFILSLTFNQETQDRVHELLDKNQEGQITAAEKEELGNWCEQAPASRRCNQRHESS